MPTPRAGNPFFRNWPTRYSGQERERESIPEKPLHKRKIKADAHAILMALAVKSGSPAHKN
jgi:hypothetical protein